jgi:hypothetical protein
MKLCRRLDSLVMSTPTHLGARECTLSLPSVVLDGVSFVDGNMF